MSFTVDISGYTPDAILAFDAEKPGDGELSAATLTLGVTDSNLSNIQDGDKTTIDEDNERIFTGFVTGRPSREGDGTLQVKLLDERAELKHEDLNRVFYYMDSAAAVEEAINKKAEQLDEIVIAKGDSIGDWSGSADQIEEYTKNGDSRDIYNYGSDAIYVGADEGASGTLRATKSLSDPVAGGQLRTLTLRYALGSVSGEVTTELELRAQGHNYVWELSSQTGDFETVELQAADADNSGDLGAGDEPALQLRYDISGTLGEAMGALIDRVRTAPFELVNRNTSFSTNNFPSTGRTIVRDASESVLTFAGTMETEDGRTLEVPSASTLNYVESPGATRDDLDITQGSTAVVDVDFDRDAEQVVNKVTVSGDGVQASYEDPASQNFYGVAPRGKPIVDDAIKTRSEAADRAKGFIRENAWKDTVTTFKIANSDYRVLQNGDDLFVEWTNQDFVEECIVRSVDTSEKGIVSLDLGVTI